MTRQHESGTDAARLRRLRDVARSTNNPARRLYAEREIARIEGAARARGEDVASAPVEAPQGQVEARRAARRPEGAGRGGGGPGISAVVDAVRDVEFPTTREELMAQAGARRVEIARGVKPPLREVLRKAGGGEFDSIEDLKTTLHRNWTAVESLKTDR